MKQIFLLSFILSVYCQVFGQNTLEIGGVRSAADGNGIISALPSANVNVTSTSDLTLRGTADIKARYDTLGSAFSNSIATEFSITNSAGPGGQHRFKTMMSASPTENSGFREYVEGRSFIDWKTPGTSNIYSSFLTSLYTSITSAPRGIHMFRSAGNSWNTPGKLAGGADMGYISWGSTDTTALIGTSPNKYTAAITSPSCGISGFVYKTFGYQKLYGGLKFWTTEGDRTLLAALQIDTLIKSVLPLNVSATRADIPTITCNSPTLGAAAKLFALQNTTGTSIVYRSNASPEGVITGSPGDITLANIAGAGSLYLKESGTGNTGWVEITGTGGGGGVSGVGAFSTVGNSAGLSITGTDISLHAANIISPGAISLTDQNLGQGTKRIYKSANAITEGLVMVNSDAAAGDLGEGISLVYRGADEYDLGMVTASQNDNAGTSMTLGVITGGAINTMQVLNGETKTTETYGFVRREVKNVGTSFDATVNVNGRGGIYVFAIDGGALTLPEPSTLTEGTEVEWQATFLTGSNAVINTAAGTSEFWSNGDSAATATLAITPGIKSGKLIVTNIAGTKYWLNSVYN